MVRTLVITGYGINCEEEVAECFNRAGSRATIKHINEVMANPTLLEKNDILALPGGFSFGDHIACGKNFSNKIRFNIFEEFLAFIASGKPVIGICNGYQILIKLGIIPNLSGRENPEMTFTNNSDQRGQGGGYSCFEDRWVHLLANKKNHSFWLNGIKNIELPVRHGEGRLVCPNQDVVNSLVESEQIAFYYASKVRKSTNTSHDVNDYYPANQYPDNPNGSLLSIAAITNKNGNVLGIMPHPEAYSLKAHYPNFLSESDKELENVKNVHQLLDDDGMGMVFFYNAVKYVS